MSPYASPQYFGFLLYILVPTILLGWMEMLSARWVLATSMAVVLLQYGPFMVWENALVALLGFMLWQMSVATTFMHLRRRRRNPWIFGAAVLLSLLPMLLAKAAGEGYLGLSYITLRCVDVVLATGDGLIESFTLAQYLSYVLFFPTLAAGPIDRFRRFQKDLGRTRSRQQFLQDLESAVGRFYYGLLYKFVVAALIKHYWLDAAAGPVSYMYAYTLYLYFDFAGYSAFAICISYLLGIHTPENFNAPLLASNIRDLWNRWHMSLSWWLRDHVYMRFVMAATRRRWFRSKYLASAVGHVLAFGLMGAWHGLRLNFLLFGLYNAALMIGHDALARWNRRHPVWGSGRGWRFLGWLITFNAFCVGMLLWTAYPLGRAVAPSAGRLESVTCEGIRGWAWDSDHPDRPVTVAITTRVWRQEVVADLPRSGLSGKRNGFFVPLPDDLKDGHPHSINAHVVQTAKRLDNAPLNFTCGDADLSGFVGTLERADCVAIGGQVQDQLHASIPPTVDIYWDGSKVATVGSDPISHHFVYDLPRGQSKGSHTVRVVVSGAAVELRNSPLVIMCP